jgi:CRP-like cAMP-binding protein
MTHQGQPSQHLYVLLVGRARYFYESPEGRKYILRWITPGHTFGGATLTSDPYIVSTEAVQDVSGIFWERSTIRSLALRFPKLLENIIHHAIGHLHWYIASYSALSSEPARRRLANLLVALVPAIGHQHASGEIEIDVTNEELANSTCVGLYTTSRILSEWERSGAIRKGRGKISIHSQEQFFQKAMGFGKSRPALP